MIKLLRPKINTKKRNKKKKDINKFVPFELARESLHGHFSGTQFLITVPNVSINSTFLK